MALGIFAGTGMDVKAEEKYEFVEIGRDYSYDQLKGLFDFDDSDEETNARKDYIKDKYFSLVDLPENETFLVFYETYDTDTTVGFRGMHYNIMSSGWSHVEIGNYDLAKRSLINDYKHWFILKKKVVSPSSASDGDAASSTPHTHFYSWVTVQEANAGQDGIEEYRCSCGDVQGRSVIPASEAAVKGLFGEIKNAPQNGTATFDSGRLYTISDYVIKKLAERTDVTTVITFEYQNQAYKMTIPAGADFTSLLADEDYFYGYFFFANAVGATIEAIA